MIEKIRVFDVGNLHARRPVVELRLAPGLQVTLAPAMVAELLAALPRMRGDVLDFPALRRLAAAQGEVPGSAVVEAFAVLAQRYMNWPVRYCSWRPDAGGDATRAVFEAATRRVGLRAGRAAAEVLASFVERRGETGLDAFFLETLGRFSMEAARETPSMDALSIARLAASRGIPWSTLPGTTYLRLGWGRHARVLIGSESSSTSAVARDIARRKRVTTSMLAAAGLPTARQKTVRRLEEAQAAARAIGFPVVVKPASGNMGKGVSVGVADDTALAAAFQRARAVSPGVLVEELVAGDEFRLLVVGGRFVAAARRRPAQIRGDGVSTVRELVARENTRPERETILPGRMGAGRPLVCDAESLALLREQGHSETTVPTAGAVVLLRRESNMSRGGDSVDETDRVHPSVRTVAERAAAVVGIDVCGVDFITTDIRRPWQETGGTICEVNTRPGLVIHSCVSEGVRRDVAADVLRMHYPDHAPARIPVVAVLEGRDSAPLRDAIAAAATRAGRRLGVVCATGSRASLGPELHVLDGAAAIPWDESIEAALVEVSAGQVTRRGLGLECIDLAVLPAGDPSVSRAGAALARLAGQRVVSAGDPNALARALEALGLSGRRYAGRAKPSAGVPAGQPPARHGTDQFTLLMVGDIGFGESYLHHPRAAPLQRLLSGEGYSACFANLATLLGSADTVIGNLEAPLSERPDPGLRDRKKYLGWSDPERAARALKDASIHAVSLANNHSLDCGKAGLAETLDRLDDCGIASFGAGPALEAAGSPLVVSFRLAGVERSLVVFAGFERRGRYERRYRWYARGGAAGVCELSPARIAAGIKSLQGRLPNPVFLAYPHWGTDYKEVEDHQRVYAAALVDAGIDLIVGHGSHTAQAIETLNGRPVVYGLGNFVWNTPGRFAKLQAKPYGLAAALRFSADDPTGVELRLYPLLTDNSVTGFQNRPVTGTEFAEAARGIAGQLDPGPRRRVDAIGHYLELRLATPPHPRPAPAARAEAAVGGFLDLQGVSAPGSQAPAREPLLLGQER